MRKALALLRQAHDYGRDLGRHPRDFAVSIRELKESGLAEAALRWLVYRGYVAFAGDPTQAPEDDRSKAPNARLRFTPEDCFVLTERGLTYARAAGSQDQQQSPGQGSGPSSPVPYWGQECRVLSVAGQVVKRFRQRAKNQEAILTAFQEAGFAPHIDSPLRPGPDQDPRAQLHDAVARLNRHQINPLIKFHMDGTGEGVFYELVPPAPRKRRHRRP
jgi:hypothetical protein